MHHRSPVHRSVRQLSSGSTLSHPRSVWRSISELALGWEQSEVVKFIISVKAYLVVAIPATSCVLCILLCASYYFSYVIPVSSNSVPTSRKTHNVSITKTNQLLLFMEILAIYCEDHIKPTDKLTVTYLLTSWLYSPLRTLAFHYVRHPFFFFSCLHRFSFSSRISFSTSFSYHTLGLASFILRSGLNTLLSILVSSFLVTSPYRFVRLLLTSAPRSRILYDPFCCINTLCVLAKLNCLTL
jgi:hypothetical protein